MEIQPTVIDVASPRRGRKPLQPTVTPPDDSGALLEQAAVPMVEAIRQSAVTLHKGELVQSLHMAETVGMIAAFQFNEAVNRVGMLKKFQEIRESKTYKGISLTDKRTGEIVTVNTWEEFCEVHGYSYRKIAEDLQNLALFGGGLLESQEALGLGYRELRKLRAGLKELPPDEQKALLEKVKTAEDKEEVLIALEEMGVVNAKLRKDVKELQATVQAKDEIAKSKNAKIDDLTVALQKATSLVPDEQREQQNALNMEMRTLLDTKCMELLGGVVALTNVAAGIFQHEDSTEDTCAYVHKRISLLCGDMSRAILDAGVDVDFTADFVPEYLRGLDAESAAPDTSETVEA